MVVTISRSSAPAKTIPRCIQTHGHAYVCQLIPFYLKLSSFPAGFVAPWALCSMQSTATTELLMITKLSNCEEAPVTTRSHTLLPTIVLAAMWRVKPPAWLSAGFALFLSVEGVAGQGTFQNLDFESAIIPSGTQPGSIVPISSALPGWSVSYSSPSGTIQATDVVYDGLSLGGAFVSIGDRFPGGIPQGNYSVCLFAGGLHNDTSSTISQTGLVPTGTVSFQVAIGWLFAAPIITLGGQTVSMVPLATYGLYGADVSSFAGKVETLSITEPPPAGLPPPSMAYIDDIRFVTIPEPSIFALFALGVLLVTKRLLLKEPSSPELTATVHYPRRTHFPQHF